MEEINLVFTEVLEGLFEAQSEGIYTDFQNDLSKLDEAMEIVSTIKQINSNTVDQDVLDLLAKDIAMFRTSVDDLMEAEKISYVNE